MLFNVRNRFKNLIENIEFKLFSNLLKRYNNIEFYTKDATGILVKRYYDDNFKFLFKTGFNCDATPMMLALESKIKKSNISFDIGANIGITTVWLARNSNIVYAFEPSHNNLKRLYENLEVNNIRNVKIINKAVSSVSGVAKFFISESYGHHTLEGSHVSRIIDIVEVETISIDDFCKINGIEQIDVLKIDVEGSELDVLKGSIQMLKANNIKMIIYEHSPILIKIQGRNPYDVFNFLREFNYHIYRITGEEVTLETINQLSQEDLYAIKS